MNIMIYYGHNDYRDYLSHHGILGQRWGKRNGPPYPLGADDHSASEKKAGWKDSLKKEQKKRAKRIKKDYTEKDDYRYLKSTRHIKKDLKELLQREDVVSAKKNLEESNKESNDFWEDKELSERYATYAALISVKNEYDSKYYTTPADIASRVWGYKYDDLDQGYGNSFSLYLLDKGIDINDYHEKVYKAEQEYEKAIEKAVNDYLGDYGDTVLKTYRSGYKQTAKHVTKQAMEALDDAKGYYEGDMAKKDMDFYRDALKQAKKDYKNYADIDLNVDFDEWAKKHNFE